MGTHRAVWAEGYLGEITNILNVQELANRYILIPICIWQSISFYPNQNNFHLTAFHEEDQVTHIMFCLMAQSMAAWTRITHSSHFMTDLFIGG